MGLIDWLLSHLIPDDAIDGDRGPGRGARSDGVQGSDTAAKPTATAATRASDVEEPRRPWWTPEGAEGIEFVEPRRPMLSTQARAIENTLVTHFDGHDLTMPPVPAVTERVLKRMRDGKSGVKQIAREISEDQVIAAEIIRMANSALYRGLYQATTLQGAVTRLGIQAVRTALMNQSMRAAMFSKRGSDNELAALIWYQSLAGAGIMRGLASLLKVDEEEASLLGLMHDIGSVIVLRFVRENEKASHALIDVPTFEYLCFESHQEFGELVATAWKLPDTLKAVVANHHSYPTQDDPLRRERLMVILSDMISAMLGYAAPAQYQLMQTRVVQDLGLSDRPEFEAFLEQLPAVLEDHLASFGAIPGSPEFKEGDEENRGALPLWLQVLRAERGALAPTT